MAGRRTGEGWLSARTVATAGAGYHADGGGLYLQVSGGARSWIYRYQLAGRRREMGLGSAAVYGLADARRRRDEARRLLAEGVDPLARTAPLSAPQARTWGEAVDDYIAAQAPGWKDDRQAAQWRESLDAYGPARDMPAAAVDTAVVLAALRHIWTTKTETASRVRGRVERVWNAERVAGAVTGDNPARWRGHLDALLPKPSKVSKAQHHRAMPYPDLPAFMQALRTRPGKSARALEFVILTVARTSEATGLQWPEIDAGAALWTVPAERMKMGRPHQVPLSGAASAVLAGMARDVPPFALSENAMLYLLQRAPPRGMGRPYTVHGFRSAFSDWAHEATDFPSHVIEMALAHTIPNKTEAAYRRGALLAKRRELMDAWAAYLA